MNGKPAKDAFIVLHPIVPAGGSTPNPGVRSQAQVDAYGTFAIATYEKGDGVPPGEYKISITWNYPSGLTLNQWGGPDRLSGLYADPEKTGLSVSVKSEGMPVFNLDEQAIEGLGKKISMSGKMAEDSVLQIEIEAELVEQAKPTGKFGLKPNSP